MTRFEREVFQYLKSKDCEVLYKGWPDFLVLDKSNGHQAFGLEVKSRTDFICRTQRELHQGLRQAGMRVGIIREDHFESEMWKPRQRGLKGSLVSSFPKSFEGNMDWLIQQGLLLDEHGNPQQWEWEY